MDLQLQDRTAIIGGASRGIGKAIALGLAQEGANVILCARNEANLRNTEIDIVKISSQNHVLSIPGDLSTYEDIRRIVHETLHVFERIDIVVNNIGSPMVKPISQLEDTEFADAFNQNCLSGLRMIKETLTTMKQQRWGRIINILSTKIKEPSNGFSLSTTSRIALAGLSKNLSLELAPFGITINNILPGYTSTQGLNDVIEQKAEQEQESTQSIITKMINNVPMGRLAQPEEIADLVTFLASERSKYITGQTISIDGGMQKSLF